MPSRISTFFILVVGLSVIDLSNAVSCTQAEFDRCYKLVTNDLHNFNDPNFCEMIKPEIACRERVIRVCRTTRPSSYYSETLAETELLKSMCKDGKACPLHSFILCLQKVPKYINKYGQITSRRDFCQIEVPGSRKCLDDYERQHTCRNSFTRAADLNLYRNADNCEKYGYPVNSGQGVSSKPDLTNAVSCTQAEFDRCSKLVTDDLHNFNDPNFCEMIKPEIACRERVIGVCQTTRPSSYYNGTLAETEVLKSMCKDGKACPLHSFIVCLKKVPSYVKNGKATSPKNFCQKQVPGERKCLDDYERQHTCRNSYTRAADLNLYRNADNCEKHGYPVNSGQGGSSKPDLTNAVSCTQAEFDRCYKLVTDDLHNFNDPNFCEMIKPEIACRERVIRVCRTTRPSSYYSERLTETNLLKSMCKDDKACPLHSFMMCFKKVPKYEPVTSRRNFCQIQVPGERKCLDDYEQQHTCRNSFTRAADLNLYRHADNCERYGYTGNSADAKGGYSNMLSTVYIVSLTVAYNIIKMA